MIKIKNLSVNYLGNTAIDNVNLEVPFGSNIGIVGPNGAGKSTLLKSLLGIVSKDFGEVTVNNESIDNYKKQIAYIPQKSEVDLTFPITVYEMVLSGLYPNMKIFQRVNSKHKKLAVDALSKLKILDLKDRQTGTLSGGQLQRAFIARALMQDAHIFLLDEPFVGTDLVSEQIIIDILHQLREDGKTILTVHHDLSDVSKYFDQLILLNKKVIAYGDVLQVFNQDNLNTTYETTIINSKLEKDGAINE